MTNWTKEQVDLLYGKKPGVYEDGATITFIIPFLTAGLNGDAGLMRQHFSRNKKVLSNLTTVILSQKPIGLKMLDCVDVVFERHTSRFMDWDNACASFKFIGDALVDAGVIKDDNPKVIVNFTPKQISSKRIEERIVVHVIPRNIQESTSDPLEDTPEEAEE